MSMLSYEKKYRVRGGTLIESRRTSIVIAD